MLLSPVALCTYAESFNQETFSIESYLVLRRCNGILLQVKQAIHTV